MFISDDKINTVSFFIAGATFGSALVGTITTPTVLMVACFLTLIYAVRN
jgi:hypothetical protein